ncbi:MAG: type IV pilus twitching motility protein PilT [Ruminococcus sp.]|nr:type IV pilus twitching motility protein PilT [Ruminococcus sp.]
MTINELVMQAREKGASDIHISASIPTTWRINGTLYDCGYTISSKSAKEMILSLLNDEQLAMLQDGNDLDFAFETPDFCRQRVNVFRFKGKLAATIRLLNDKIPTLSELNLPDVLQKLADEPRGLILVTGPTGSGKSTTLAAMIDHINHTRAEHILTIEDPIEYVYTLDKATIHQREVGSDVKSFAGALRSALREDPDIILVGEMRDYETISAAVTAAETGHLVLSTLHTIGAAQTIDRIIDSCPPEKQNQIRTQLSSVVKGVITQSLIPTLNGKERVAATEILIGTDAACNLIRENKCHQLQTVMQSGAGLGMHTLNSDLSRLVASGVISKQNALAVSPDKSDLMEYLG